MRSTSAISAASLHAVNVRDGKPLLDVQDRVRDQVVAGRRRTTSCSSARTTTHLYALDARTGQAALEGADARAGARDAGRARRARRSSPAATRIFRAIRIADGQEVYQIETGAYTGASPVVDGDRAYFGTFNNEVLALDLEAAQGRSGGIRDPDAQFPFYSSAALDGGRVIVGGRDKMVRAHRRRDRQGRLDVRDAGARRFVAGRRRRPRLRRLERRPPLRARRRVGQEALGVRHRRRHHRLARHRRGRVVIGAQDGRLYVFG